MLQEPCRLLRPSSPPVSRRISARIIGGGRGGPALRRAGFEMAGAAAARIGDKIPSSARPQPCPARNGSRIVEPGLRARNHSAAAARNPRQAESLVIYIYDFFFFFNIITNSPIRVIAAASSGSSFQAVCRAHEGSQKKRGWKAHRQGHRPLPSQPKRPSQHRATGLGSASSCGIEGHRRIRRRCRFQHLGGERIIP